MGDKVTSVIDKQISLDTVDVIPEAFWDQALLYKQIMTTYYAAIKAVQVKLEVLNDELSIRTSRSPIEFIKSRLKRSESIVNKLDRYGFEKTLDNLDKIHDIAGVRVVCTYIDDIYDIANMLVKQDDVRLIQIKDYIKKPKKSGYRSLHLVIALPVYFSSEKRTMKVEIQIRTIAMDFWASLEHDMEYKHKDAVSDNIKLELKKCADIIHDTDQKMQKIKNELVGIRNGTV